MVLSYAREGVAFFPSEFSRHLNVEVRVQYCGKQLSFESNSPSIKNSLFNSGMNESEE